MTLASPVCVVVTLLVAVLVLVRVVVLVVTNVVLLVDGEVRTVVWVSMLVVVDVVLTTTVAGTVTVMIVRLVAVVEPVPAPVIVKVAQVVCAFPPGTSGSATEMMMAAKNILTQISSLLGRAVNRYSVPLHNPGVSK